MERIKTLMKLTGMTGILFTFGIIFAGCDSTDVPDLETEAFETAEVQDLFTVVSSEAALSADQQHRFRRALQRHDRPDREPGYLWIVADSLADTLTDEQKERLFNRIDEIEGFHPFLGLRGVPGGGGYYGIGGLRGAMHRFGHAGVDSVLDLTDEQRENIRAIHEDYREEFRSLGDAKRAGELSPEEFLRSLRDLHEQLKSELDAVLTEDQKAALEQFRADREADFEAFRAEVRAVRDEVLSLTAEQSDAFNALLEDQLDAREVLMEQWQAGEITLAELRDEVGALRDATLEALESLLTPEQFEVVQIHTALIVRLGIRGHRGRHDRRSG